MAHQNDDGGWGEDLRSYDDPACAVAGTRPRRRPRGRSQRLLAARRAKDAVDGAASRYLVDTQRPDGSWDEPWFTGTGFPGYFYINYHLYRLVFPVVGARPLR